MRRFLACLLVLTATVPSPAQEGRLQRVRDAVDKPDDDNSSKKNSDKNNCDSSDWTPFTSSSSDSCSSSKSCDDGDGFPLELVGYALIVPFVLPHVALKDDLYRPGYFPHFPYAEDRPGYLRFLGAEGEKPGPLSTLSARLSVETGSNFDGLDRVGTRLRIDSTSRFGLELRYDYFEERLPCGCHDQFDFGSLDLTYRFAQSANMQMYAGLGLNALDTGSRTRYGFDFIYGADIFPVKPIVASLSVEAGTPGDAGLFRARGTIGANWRNFESFVGYDYLNIGGVDLQGPLVGLRFWY
jgi:hypothetical protein